MYKRKKEVDFALVKNDAIERIIEVKSTKSDISRDLLYFHEKYNVPATQVIKQLKHSQIRNNIKIVDAMKFLQALYL
jgi:replication initiation and membrane attachment protein DnaB